MYNTQFERSHLETVFEKSDEYEANINKKRKTFRLLYFGAWICFGKMGERCAINCFILHIASCSY